MCNQPKRGRREKVREPGQSNPRHVSERCTALHRHHSASHPRGRRRLPFGDSKAACPPPSTPSSPLCPHLFHRRRRRRPSPPLYIYINQPHLPHTISPSQPITPMASPSPSSSPNPSPSPPPPSSSTAAAPRRLPPPCWTNDEAAAVAEAFRDKWLVLGRGNLRAQDWQEVADAVAARCGTAKTPVQCRHKVEKLRKRYRNEKRRLGSSARPKPSSWALFSIFDAMEPAGSAAGRPVVTVARPPPPPSPSPSTTPSISTSSDAGESEERSHLYANGYDARLVIPKLMQRSNLYDEADTFRPKSAMGRQPIPSKKKRRLDEDADPMSEVVWAIQQLGERFMRVEQMKMEMAREVEKMRMETEMKRMKMMMETLLYPYHSIEGSKRQKKMPTSLH